MVLTPEREAELIEQNMPKIYRAVDNFMASYPQMSLSRALCASLTGFLPCSGMFVYQGTV